MPATTKRVAITGVSRGLGRALVDRFCEAGWTVAGCGRSDAAIGGLSRSYGLPHRFEALDVADTSAVDDWARRTIAEIGAPDLLLNNAAVITPNAPLWEVSPDDFSHILDVNLKGVHNVIVAFVPAMIERKTGVVVNFSSGWGRSTSAEVAPYCATKWGIEGLTQALSQELPRGLAAVALNPGIIDTDMLRSCFGNGARSYPSPEQWSRSAAPFLMNLSSRDNGQALTVPGIPT